MSKPYGGEDFQNDLIELGRILNENPDMDIFTAMKTLGDKQRLEENIANSNDEYHDENHNYKTDDRRLYIEFRVDWDDTNSELDTNQYTRIAVTPADYYDSKKQWFGGWLGPILTDVLYSLGFGEYSGCIWFAYKQLSVTDIVEAFKKIGWDVLYLPESTRYETWAEALDNIDSSDDNGYADEWHYKNGDYKTNDKRLYFKFDVDESDVDEDYSDGEDIDNYTRIVITPADYYDKSNYYFDDWFGPTLTGVLVELDFGEDCECIWSCWRKVTADELKAAFAKIGWELTEFPDEPIYNTWSEAYENYKPEEDDDE